MLDENEKTRGQWPPSRSGVSTPCGRVRTAGRTCCEPSACGAGRRARGGAAKRPPRRAAAAPDGACVENPAVGCMRCSRRAGFSRRGSCVPGHPKPRPSGTCCSQPRRTTRAPWTVPCWRDCRGPRAHPSVPAAPAWGEHASRPAPSAVAAPLLPFQAGPARRGGAPRGCTGSHSELRCAAAGPRAARVPCPAPGTHSAACGAPAFELPDVGEGARVLTPPALSLACRCLPVGHPEHTHATRLQRACYHSHAPPHLRSSKHAWRLASQKLPCAPHAVTAFG
jgi:hypothetical protein